MQQVKPAMGTGYLEGVALAQRSWAATPLRMRARLMGRLRRRIASSARELAETVPTSLPGALNRTVADTLVSEVLPLVEACGFLEREASWILAPRHLGGSGRPLWMMSVSTEVERAPWGIVLVLAAGNYPLLLPGVQTLQALMAGNAVLLKPAPGTETVAFALQTLLVECGLPPELLTLLDSSVEAGIDAITAGVDHVVLTGSAATGKAVMHQLADTLTPSTMELSGCDAVFVLVGADVEHTLRALAMGMRFNGSFTCMAPRRVFLVGMKESAALDFETRLAGALMDVPPVPLPGRTFGLLRELVQDAQKQDAEILLNGIRSEDGSTFLASVTLIAQATPSLLSMQMDIFAPILSVMRTSDMEEALAASAACPYALTASVFGPQREARSMAAKVRGGNVLINDVMIPTADPRVAFGGRGCSGFGVTRGVEGLLAMTTPKTIQTQRSRSGRAYEPTTEGHVELFAGLTQMLHAGGLSARFAGLKRMVGAARKLK